MPSPSLVPDSASIDLDHLRRMTLGDRSLEREVLTLFERQAAQLLTRLAALPADAAALAHTLKGSARGIGAFAVADAAEHFEEVLRSRNSKTEATIEAMTALKHAVADACDAIDGLLRTN